MKDIFLVSSRVLVVAMLAIGELLLLCMDARAQAVGIGSIFQNSSVRPDSSALLQLEDTSKGLLVPRMTDSEIIAIPNPATGDLAYSTTSKNFFYFNGYFWSRISTGYGWALTGNSGTNPAINFLGTIDSADLIIRTNSRKRMLLTDGGVGITSNFNTAPKLIFYNDGSTKYTAFTATVQSGNVHYTMPAKDGDSASAFSTNGSGAMSWVKYGHDGSSGALSLWLSASIESLLSDSSGNRVFANDAIIAGENNTDSAFYATIWGANNKVSGIGGLIAGGIGSSAGFYSAVRGGSSNSASTSSGSNQGSVSYGGLYNNANGWYNAIIGGDSNSTASPVSGQGYSTIINGVNNTSNSQYQLLFGSNIPAGNSNTVIFHPPGPTETRLGIGTNNPSQAADVVGNVEFSSSLMPGDINGLSPQWLHSYGSTPTWSVKDSIPTSAWGTTGNTGSNPSTNFIGTTDTEDLAIRTSNTERMRITQAGFVGIGTSAPTHQLQSVLSDTTVETAAIFGNATSSADSQSIGVWGSANASSSNTGTIGILGTGAMDTSAGATNVALQISQGEFTMGRTTESPSPGKVVDTSATGTSYSQQGPSGIIQLSLGTDLIDTVPTAGKFQDLGKVTINNQYISANSIILAGIVEKDNDAIPPYAKNSIYKVDVASRSAGACVVRIGMIPFVSDTSAYQNANYIRLAYAVINPGK